MKHVVLVALGGLMLQACSLGGQLGIPYWQEGDRTFTAPIEEVREAARRSLDQSGLTINQDAATVDGRRLVAGTMSRTVRIELENVTYNMTRMSVSVSGNDGFSRDHTLEQNILKQTGDVLAGKGVLIGSAGVAR